MRLHQLFPGTRVDRLAFIAVLIVSLLPALRATAANDERDWVQAFERAKRASPGFAVESVEEFRKLTDHYARLSSDGVTVASFELPSGGQVHCIEISSQRSLAVSGQPLQAAPGTLPAADTVTAARKPGRSRDRPGAEFGLDATEDAAGNERACPARSFPRLMPRLENLYHFRRLEDVFQKTPRGGGGRSADSNAPARLVRDSSIAAVHEYAFANQSVNNCGMSADFNLWSPAVESNEFSLSQLWVTRGLTTDGSLQTIETGWQNYPRMYGDSKSHLFIYYTTGSYQAGTGCYNLDCSGFVQIDSTVVLGGEWESYSTQGGTQVEISLAFFRDPSPPHNWWLKYNDTWVGYYPNSLYNSKGIADYSDRVNFGGEIIDTRNGSLHTETGMGSGHFPGEGYGAAAYTKKIQYWDASGTQFDATGLTPTVTNASYYDLSLGSSSDPSWLSYFFFGGPGRVESPAPTTSFTFSANPRVAQPIEFTDTSTGSPTSWSWTFGDGPRRSGMQNPIHSFASAGTFTVTLTASNSSGSNTRTETVVVSPGPDQHKIVEPAPVEISPQRGPAPPTP